MSDTLTLYALTLKRLLKDKGLVLSFLLLPLFILLTSILWVDVTDKITVGIYFEDSNYLIPDTNIFTFIIEDSEKTLQENLAKGIYEVGYLINKKTITVLESSQSSLTNVINEIIYASHFLEFGYLIALDFMKDLEGLNSQEYIEYSKERIQNINKINFDFGEVTQEKSITEITIHQAIRGLTAIFLMFCVFISCSILYDDKKRGIYQRILPLSSKNKMNILFYASIFTLSFAVGLLTIGISHFTLGLPIYGVMKEIVVLFSYLVCLAGISSLLNAIIKQKELFISLLPFIVVISVILSPILIDITQFIPALDFLHYLLPPAIYLNAIDGNILFSIYMLLYGTTTYSISFLIQK